MSHPIPVICDRCRAEGTAGEAGFAELGGLLHFEPVPRLIERVDGWTPECQRGFIAALAATGSKRRAAAAVGKDAEGAARLREAPGAESFAAAWDRAMAVFRETGTSRIAASVGGVSARARAWAHRPATPPEPSEEEQEKAKLEGLARIVHKYVLKVGQERQARLEGRIVEADYYLRQMTWLEVALDLMSGDGLKLLRDFRESGRHLIDIAETPMSEILGEMRRRKWAELGEPPRPEHPPRRYLEHHGRFSTEPNECTRGGLPQSHEEQMQVFRERHVRDAEAQLEWEARARQDFESRRGSAT